MPSHFFSVLKRTILAITVESSYAFCPLHYCNDDVTIVMHRSGCREADKSQDLYCIVLCD